MKGSELSGPELNADAEYFKNIFINSPIGIYIIQDRKFRFVNPEFKRISGYDEQELLSIDPNVIVHPEDREALRESAVKMLKGERSSPYVFRAINKNGDIKWIMESVTSIQYGGRRATLGYFMDNTDRELAKEAMRISEDKFQKAFRSIPDPVFITGLKTGIMIDVNEAFLHSTGYNMKEVIGRTSIELGLWPDPDQRAEIMETLRRQGTLRDFETRVRVKSGEIRFALWSAEVIECGGETCLVAVARDITARKRTELGLDPNVALFET